VRDELALRALVDQAFELRGSPYFSDGIDAIVEWHEKRFERGLWRRMELVSLLRDSKNGGARKSGPIE